MGFGQSWLLLFPFRCACEEITHRYILNKYHKYPQHGPNSLNTAVAAPVFTEDSAGQTTCCLPAFTIQLYCLNGGQEMAMVTPYFSSPILPRRVDPSKNALCTVVRANARSSTRTRNYSTDLSPSCRSSLLPCECLRSLYRCQPSNVICVIPISLF